MVTLIYHLPLILTALLHVDLINTDISLHVSLSGQHDIALFLNDVIDYIESTRKSIITS